MKNILVVDDQAIIRQLLEISLRSGRRRVFLAESGERAVQLALQRHFDLIIVDLMMPGGMDGFETIEYLQKNAADRLCPIMILSAKDQQAERDRARLSRGYRIIWSNRSSWMTSLQRLTIY
ncbi:MAG: response regulator [Syntrophotaleaceae bacterium]